MIKIGVLSCFMYPDKQRNFFNPKTLCYFENDMANYLCRENVMPVLIPNLHESVLFDFLAQMDGFVLQGGSDLCPVSYGENYLDKEKWPGDEFRDRYELKILDFAIKNAKPVLGICRGAQLINVFFGGTLYQDLPTQYKTHLKHRDAVIYDQNYHSIEFISDQLLSQFYSNEDNLYVNSVHHQGIKTLGHDLVVEAISPEDQLIEAFSYKNLQDRFVLAVQWHPEFSHVLKDKVISAEPIYTCLLNAVNERKKM